jgi:hypothetical protein
VIQVKIFSISAITANPLFDVIRLSNGIFLRIGYNGAEILDDTALIASLFTDGRS